MLSLEGKQLGNYDVIRRIRVGGMGAVYEGKQRTAFGRRVAIKVILGDYATDRDMRRRFAREARTVARLHHPHILPLIEFGDANGILYLVMPFIEGGTLTSYLRRSLPDLAEVAGIYQQLLDAVEYAHDEGLIHRDIKASNVLLELRRSGPPYVYLADFGLVRTLRPDKMDDTGKIGKPIPLDQVPGTPQYMAPEQTYGIVTPQTDIYALGVLLYQLLTGELPYHDPDDIRVIQMQMQAPIPAPSDHDASIPKELDEVVRTAMAKRRDDRYHTIAELRTAFLAALKGPVAVQQEETAPERLEGSSALTEPQPRRTRVLSTNEQPAPIIMPRRGRNLDAPVVVREARVKARTTDSIRQRSPRITEEPAPARSKRIAKPLLLSMLVPVGLLILLLVPRVLGINIFPADIPVLGMPSVATIYVTAQSRTFQNSYVLTSSPQVNAPDLATHTIPNRVVTATASDSSTVSTTGIHTTDGVAARGTVEFINSSNHDITESAQTVFTSTTGVQVRLSQDVVVPARQDGQNGKSAGDAVAVSDGVAGNIAAHTLDGTCCNNGVSIRNSNPFSGGVDAQQVHVVAQADLDNVRNQLLSRLERQALQNMQHQLATDETFAIAPTYNVMSTATPPIGSQAEHVVVTVNVAGNAIVYNRSTATHIAAQLLNKDAAETLGQSYHMQGSPSLPDNPTCRSGKNGIVFLSITVKGLWLYNLTEQEMSNWPQAIKGSTTQAALAFLNGQPGVKSVEITLPFGSDHLPSAVSDIKIVLVNGSATSG
ncbi:MAG TPA: protein kinase [Ktedonobacteraceae bacterium]|nr:protein kinase [Ktedonobacteraceae bacterium]